jgi:predicted TIM-barrel fold metal-dependent hydrolase
MDLDRRQFLQRAGAGALALAVAPVRGPAATPAVTAPPLPPPSSAGSGLPAGWRAMRKIDAHAHVFSPVHRPNADWSQVEAMIEAADALGIEQLFCSHPVTAGVLADIETVREANDSVLAAIKRYPRRIVGYCFVQPGTGLAGLEEMERCAAAGMVGVKLYNQFKFSDPVVFPVAEKCIQRHLLFLGHSGHVTDPRTMALQPKISDAREFCALATRYPELSLILGHLNGGGDWEWTLRALRACPNVYLDTSGSVLEDDAISDCARQLGHQRMLFATDMTMEGGVGKILAADLTPAQREDVFYRNLQALLARTRS